jgi:hypothetical protein
LRVEPVNARSPAYDYGFDALAGFYALPITVAPSTQEGQDICADVILAKKLESLVRRRFACVNESIDALLSWCHPLRWALD